MEQRPEIRKTSNSSKFEESVNARSLLYYGVRVGFQEGEI